VTGAHCNFGIELTYTDGEIMLLVIIYFEPAGTTRRHASALCALRVRVTLSAGVEDEDM
jgi:hypothetical protein